MAFILLSGILEWVTFFSLHSPSVGIKVLQTYGFRFSELFFVNMPIDLMSK